MREVKLKNNKDIETENRKSFMIAKGDKLFCSLCAKLKTDEKVLMKYTSKLENTCAELKNCSGCKGLDFCKNEVNGFVDYPYVEDDFIIFSYTPCKYKKEMEKNKSRTLFYETPTILRNAKMSELYIEEEREKIIEYLDSFIKKFPKFKGVYLYGSFGSGKSYILNAAVNELSKKGYKCVSIYYPSLLKKLKDTLSYSSIVYQQIFSELEKAEILLIDDIGAENNTVWARDEVLGTLLQERMDEGKITLFSSNYTLEELEEHLSITKDGKEAVKARRIIERIKQLSTPFELTSKNKRDDSR